MTLWKNCQGKSPEININQLIKRLQVIANQKNAEIMQLALQSIIEELSDQRS